MLSKRVLAAAMMVMMTGAIFAGCGNDEKGATKSDIKIGLSTDEGGLNDKSFNQAADTGIKKAKKEFGFEYNAIESKGKEDYTENLETLIGEGSQLVFGVGYKMLDAIKAAAEKYPETNFTIIDEKVELPNVESITFKEHEGSFLMGVIAGEMAKDGKVGFIGGYDNPLINKFEVGFAAGVMSVNPKAGEDLLSRKTVKYADSFSDVNKGYESGKALIDEGCTIVYHAAGGVGMGMFRAVKEARDAGNGDVWAIGVDMDQAAFLAASKTKEDQELAKVIVSSMIKRVDTATYNAAKDVVEKKFKGGTHVELGLVEEGVGVAETTKDNTPEDVMKKVEEYKKAIIEGKFEVPATIDELKEFKAPEL